MKFYSFNFFSSTFIKNNTSHYFIKAYFQVHCRLKYFIIRQRQQKLMASILLFTDECLSTAVIVTQLKARIGYLIAKYVLIPKKVIYWIKTEDKKWFTLCKLK